MAVFQNSLYASDHLEILSSSYFCFLLNFQIHPSEQQGIGVASSSCPRLRRAGHYRSPPSAEKYQGIAPTPGPFMLLPETSMESDPGSITLPISSRDKRKAVARSASASSSHPMPALIKIPIKSPRKALRKAPSHIPLFIHRRIFKPGL